MLKLSGYGVLAVGGIMLWTYANTNLGKNSDAMAIAAQELRKQLPMRVNETTTLQSVVGSGNVLMYNHIMNYNAEETDRALFGSIMIDNLKQNVCGNIHMADAMKIGGVRYF